MRSIHHATSGAASLAALALAGLLGADPAPVKPGEQERSLGKDKYFAYVGKKYAADKKANVMIMLHDNTNGIASYKRFFAPEADSRGWLFVTPQAPGGAWKPSDEKFILALVDDLKKDFNIDDTHMLIAGVYESGNLAADVALANPKRFSALALLASMAPSWDETKLAGAKSLSIYIAQGAKSGGYSSAKSFVEKARKAGLRVEFFEHPSEGDDVKLVNRPAVIKWYEELAVADVKAWLEEGKKLAGEEKFAEAVALLKKAVDAGGTSAPGKEAAAELDKISKFGDTKIEEALALTRSDDFEGASKALGEIEKKFAGLPAAERAKKELAALKADPRLKELLEKKEKERKEKDAEKEFAAAEAREKAKDYESALAAYQAVATNFAGTSFEEKAKAKIKEMEADPNIQKAIADAKAAGEVKGLVSKGDNYKKNKMWEKAIEIYKEIEKKYPGTPYAEDAKKKRLECEKAMK